jgi:hypothetical protein
MGNFRSFQGLILPTPDLCAFIKNSKICKYAYLMPFNYV